MMVGFLVGRDVDQGLEVAGPLGVRVAGRRPIISSAVSSGQIQVVAAVYDIRSGRVSLV